MKRYVILTGGLGNQLFQVAAALDQRELKIELITDVGCPRGSNGKPDILLFELPPELSVVGFPYKSRFWRKLFGFSLRRGLAPQKLENVSGMRLILDALTSILFSFALKERVSLHISTDVGYCMLPQRKNLFIGYHQTYRHLSDSGNHKILMNLYPKNQNQKIQELIAMAKTFKPIIVHVRLGDYETLPSFGILSPYYYEQAIDELRAEYGPPVWFFTNNVSGLTQYLSVTRRHNAKLIDDSGLDPAQLLEVMRYGSGYILGNSSFSWWAAQLRYDRAAVVVAPKPWFRSLPEPLHLIPEDWVRLAAHWQSFC